jgi:glutamyl-tRNA reductase
VIVLVGLSHKSAPLEVREQFAIDKQALGGVVKSFHEAPGVAEVLLLSTCNRVEVVARPVESGEAGERRALAAVRDLLARHAPSVRDLGQYLYEKSGDEAVRHVFRVAASLDSMVLGEPQILGQVKEAYDIATAAGALRGSLGRCFHRAFSTAKRVRTDTQLGAGTVSISSVAVDLARSIFGGLEQSTVLLVGAGEMAEAAAKALGKNARAIRVVNRSVERAFELATHFGGAAAPLDALEQELAYADVVIASTGSPHYVVTQDMVKRAMKARRGRTLLFVDIAVPRNVEPGIHQIDNVFVYDVDDLQSEVARTLSARAGEAQQAERIVDEEVRGYLSWAASQKLQPLIVGLRERTKVVLTQELERTLASRLKHLSDDDKKALAQMVESATSKLVHMPVTKLKESTGTDDELLLSRATSILFDLEPAASSVEPEPSLSESTEVAAAPAPAAGRVVH